MDETSAVNSFSPTLEKCLNDIIKKEGYVTNNVYKRLVSTEGGNYLGELYEVDVKGKTNNGDQETNLFVKRSLSVDGDNFISMDDAYSKEAFFYKELAKIYTDLQDEAKVPKEERYKVIKNYDVDTLEAIVLKNMSRLGYSTTGRMNVISLKFAQLAVEELAKFHALSFVLKKKMPDYFEKKLKVMTIPVKFNDAWKNCMKAFANITIENVDDEFKQKIKDYVPRIEEIFSAFFKFDEARICCLCHGDYRSCNILKKEVDGQVAEIIPIDYQLIHFGSPITDFIYLIYLGTDRQFRQNHLEDLKNLYHKKMDTFLKYFDMDVEDVYPRREFDVAFEEKVEFGLILTLIYIPFLFVHEEEVPDITKDMSNINFKPYPLFQERVHGSLKEFQTLGLF